MKAAIVEKPGVLGVRDIPDPQMGQYDALCEMLYGATCVGTDLHVISGRVFRDLRYPVVLGHESVGRVMETGKRVRNLKKGDLVTRVGTTASPTGQFDVAWGGFVELGIARDHWAMRDDGLPHKEWNDSRVNQIVPRGIDPAAATMIITWRETLSYITRMGVGAGASLLVIGSGGSGLAFVAHGANLGATHVAVVGNARREDIARAAGATEYLDYKAENVVRQISEAHPEGFDFIVDVVGKKELADTALPLLKPGGAIGIYGIDNLGERSINPDRSRGTFTYYNGGYDAEETHNQVISLMQQGSLRADLWLDFEHPFPLENINEAYETAVQRKVVKALVRLSGDGS